ncbi:AraC family transcriptional regulator [Anabaenopsis sp. FSS-46]|uniref:AraC family transcriptional regulator n=1 Tax=Anabaenopsis sp. FSS-46 TaxID=2971766 RepID=UPI0024737F6F|nr:AraC family transcriptional regulator [Anabaenopsis sp. FSS-46]MDH6099581.1 AraC family transcriptional regulator [Anabaenopsis sp. FSS-46]
MVNLLNQDLHKPELYYPSVNSQLKVYPQEFNTLMRVLPYQPTVFHSMEPDQVIMLHYDQLPPHEVPEHCVKGYQFLAVSDINCKTELECRLDGKLYPRKLLGYGSIGIFPDGASHCATWNQDMGITLFFLKTELVNDLVQDRMTNGDVAMIPRSGVEDGGVYHLGMALKAELAAPPDCQMGSVYQDTLINALVMRLVKHHSSAGIRGRKDPGGLGLSTLKLLIDYIEGYLDQNIRLGDLAALVGYSQPYLCSMFKESMGIPLHQYIIQQRVKRAAVLLRSSQMFLVDIAVCCGFYSHSHLTRYFKRVMGVNPKEYR